jgi:hypothetical protein
LAGKCAAITGKGQPCKGLVRPGNDYCPAHDPNRQEARRRAASKAGSSKPGTEVAELKEQLSDLYTGVLTGMVDSKIGAVAAQIAGARIRLLETERRIKETEELEERLERLERVQASRQGGMRRWP